MTPRTAILTVVTAISAISTYAKDLLDQQHDSLLQSHKIIIIDGAKNGQSQNEADSTRRLIDRFYYNQFRHIQDPESPYFLFMSKDAKLAMGIGGAVRMRGYFDWGGAIPSPAFAPYLIPQHPDPAQMRQFGTTPAGTCLFFRVIGQNKALGNYQLYIEANFNGYQARDFLLKKAYAIINDFTIGYASSTFSDPAAVPPTVDAQGPNNKLANTAVLVRWMPRIKNDWVLAISAETPSTKIDTDGIYTKEVSNWLPDGATFVQYEWNRTSHIRLSALIRALSYRDMTTGKNHNKAGWGLLLSSVTHPTANITTYTTLNYGRGYASYCGDMLIGKYDMIASPEKQGQLYMPALFGWNIGIQYNIRPDLFISTSFSQLRLLPQHETSPSEYRYGMFGNVNIFWNLTPRIMAGAEFDYGMRKNTDGTHRWARRIGAVVQFAF